jgi:hypothetical protein
MKTQRKRVATLERKAPPIERQFIGWKGNPWTPAQEAAAIRRRPNCRIFWRSLLEPHA